MAEPVWEAVHYALLELGTLYEPPAASAQTACPDRM